MNTYYQTPAIVLAARDEREADRVIIFYTRDFGKIKALARGIRLTKSKLRGHIVLGALLRIAFVEGKESYHLVDSEILSDKKMLLAPSCASFLEQMTGERAREKEVWEFLVRWLLDQKEDLLAFQAAILSLLGFLPHDSIPSPQVIRSALIANHLG